MLTQVGALVRAGDKALQAQLTVLHAPGQFSARAGDLEGTGVGSGEGRG